MYDVKTVLKAAGAVTSSGDGTGFEVGSGKITARMVVDVSAIEIASDDEVYELHLIGGDDASFTNNTSLACLELGAAGGIEGNVDSEVGRYELLVTNEKGGVIYPHVRIRYVISGTISTGINFAARLAEV